MGNNIVEVVHGVVSRAPEWVGQDFASNDGAVRIRAEEALTAMIGAALTDDANHEPGVKRN